MAVIAPRVDLRGDLALASGCQRSLATRGRFPAYEPARPPAPAVVPAVVSASARRRPATGPSRGVYLPATARGYGGRVLTGQPAQPPRYREPIEGSDAMMLKFEGDDVAMHTLKIAILDPGDRGRPVSLEEIAAVVPRYLPLSPRFTARAERGSDRRWHWVEDEAFDLARHLDERWLERPDGLDELCGELATARLDRDRPLWAITLAHGLAEGHQAVVVRAHHGLMDGLAAANLFAAVTSEQPGDAPTPAPAAWEQPGPRPPLAARLRAVASAAREVRRRSREFGPDESVPGQLMRRSPINRPSGGERHCASRSIPAAQLRELADLTGAGMNGALHGALARGMRSHLLAQGHQPRTPLVANFAVAEDRNSTRVHGNRLATARVWLHVEEERDPLGAVARIAQSCRQSVALRRHRGFDLQLRAAEFAGFVAVGRRHLARFAILTPVHLLTAYVSGPRSERWLGDVRVAGWTSFAVSIAPTDVSITAYTYAGRLWLGVITTPESMPDPAGFLRRCEEAVGELLALARAEAAVTAG